MNDAAKVKIEVNNTMVWHLLESTPTLGKGRESHNYRVTRLPRHDCGCGFGYIYKSPKVASQLPTRQQQSRHAANTHSSTQHYNLWSNNKRNGPHS